MTEIPEHLLKRAKAARDNAADDAAAAIFAHRGEVATVLATIPVMAAAHRAVQAVGVNVEGIGPVVAVDVLGNHVAQDAAQHRAADRGAAVAVGHACAQKAASQRAEDGAGRLVAAAAAILFIGALAIVAAFVTALFAAFGALFAAVFTILLALLFAAPFLAGLVLVAVVAIVALRLGIGRDRGKANGCGGGQQGNLGFHGCLRSMGSAGGVSGRKNQTRYVRPRNAQPVVKVPVQMLMQRRQRLFARQMPLDGVQHGGDHGLVQERFGQKTSGPCIGGIERAAMA